MFHIFQGLGFVVFEIPWTFDQVERYETKSPSEAETNMRIESMRSHPTAVCHGGFKLGIVGSHVSQKLKVEALKIQSHERHGQNVCEWTEFMWGSFNSRQRSYLAFQPANSAQMSRIPISSSGFPRSCSMLRGNCHESCQRTSHAILRNISKWENTVFSLWAIRPSLTQFSTHQNMVLSLRAARKKSLVKHKFLWWKCVLTKTLVSISTLIKILSFFRSRRRQAATFLHGAERVAQMTQKALQLALNVSNEAWEDATVDNLVTYLDNYT